MRGVVPIHVWLLAIAIALAGCTSRLPTPQSPNQPGTKHALDARLGGAAPRASKDDPDPAPFTSPSCAAPRVPGTSVEVGQVAAETPGLRCCTYLRRSATKPRALPVARIAFVQSGTGIYSVADGSVGPVATHALESDDAALLTLDKPGVAADPQGALLFDREAYRQYTLADLVTCAQKALGWAFSRDSVDPHAGLTLHGHSEGGQVMLRMLASSSRLDEAHRVTHTIVSGLLLEPFASAMDRQIAIFMPFEIEAFHEALAQHDDDYLLQHALSSRYLEHPTARQDLTEVLSELSVRRPRWRVEVYQGERDTNAPLSLVKSFEEKNEKARSSGRPSLDLRVHVYPRARHYLDQRFDSDVRALLSK